MKYYAGDLVMRVIASCGLDFARGNIIKYVARAGRKDDELADLKKARWYLDWAIKELEDDSVNTGS